MTENDLKQLEAYGAQFAGDTDSATPVTCRKCGSKVTSENRVTWCDHCDDPAFVEGLHPTADFYEASDTPTAPEPLAELTALRARVAELEALKERLAMLKTERDTYRDDLHAANDELDVNDKRLLDLTRLCDGETALPDGTHYNAAQLIGEIREFVNEVSSERDSLLAENAKLKAALQPFALAAGDKDVELAEPDAPLLVETTRYQKLGAVTCGIITEDEQLQIKHLRAAAAALKAGKP